MIKKTHKEYCASKCICFSMCPIRHGHIGPFTRESTPNAHPQAWLPLSWQVPWPSKDLPPYSPHVGHQQLAKNSNMGKCCQKAVIFRHTSYTCSLAFLPTPSIHHAFAICPKLLDYKNLVLSPWLHFIHASPEVPWIVNHVPPDQQYRCEAEWSLGGWSIQHLESSKLTGLSPKGHFDWIECKIQIPRKVTLHKTFRNPISE